MKALSQNRRHPLMGLALLLLGLLVTGGLYSVASTVNQAQAATQVTAAASADDISEGEKLFNANCASCHGTGAAGGPSGPSLIGVGAASVDFQVGTGRMPMQMNGPQAQVKPNQFNDEQTAQLAAYVASLGADCIVKPMRAEHLDELAGLLKAAGYKDDDPADYTRYGSARQLYHFHSDNTSAY